MRHQKSGKKLGRTPAHRKALFRNMVTSLLKHERIVTTEVKAKEVGRLTEKMITLGKRGDLHARRQTIAFIKSNEVIKRLFSEYSERYKARDGGYTRVIKLEPRSGDNAPMAIVELVDRPVQEKKAESKDKTEKAAKKSEKAAAPKKKTAAKETKAPAKAKKETKEAAKPKKAEPKKSEKKSEKTEKKEKKTADTPKKAKKPSSAKKKDDSAKEKKKES
ncbi:50S ribosomal protein L17 [bacterium]|nr:MAG: 50S ribosomal protein L17 [bacterium]